MKVLKFWYHLKAGIKKIVYKLIFGSRIKIGKKTTWRDGFHIAIEGEGKVIIGASCFLNHNCSVNALESVSIGDGTIFGENCHIYDHNHRFRNDEASIKSQGYSVEKTVIGSHCWFGSNVVVLKGVTIGDNVTIGAGCVISEDIPEGSIVTCDSGLNILRKEIMSR